MSGIENEIKEEISRLFHMLENNAFPEYIYSIQFPYFRNLELNTKLTFDFPLTAFVGQNGSGKSSTLHALFGAPLNYTPYKFWFSTDVDPVKEVDEGGFRHSFFYTYKDRNGNLLEVLKLRIKKRDNPDYWETARPNLSYGMQPIPDGGRNSPVQRKVIHLDFRGEISAFDKYFYFFDQKNTLLENSKQEYLRKKSKGLKKILDGHYRIYNSRFPQNKPLVRLNDDELKEITFILGRNYIQGDWLEHKLFLEWGTSIYMTTDFFKYSEAFAGSGEIAVIRLVKEVLNAEDNSLILLDEPEVSLHPGAQRRLVLFLLNQIKLKKHQVILSTHSPSIIDNLPNKSIKVFSQLPDGKFHVENEKTFTEAFYFIGHTNPVQKTLIFEDELAKELVSRVAKKMGDDVFSIFNFVVPNGGESVIKQNYITIYSLNPPYFEFVFFDGDQNPGHQINPGEITLEGLNNDNLKELIQNQTRADIKFFPDGNQQHGGNQEQLLDMRKKYLDFYFTNVKYLPKNTPEEIIWNDELAESILQSVGKSEDDINEVLNLPDFKDKFYKFSELVYGKGGEIRNSYLMFIENWVNTPNVDYNHVKGLIESIRGLNIG